MTIRGLYEGNISRFSVKKAPFGAYKDQFLTHEQLLLLSYNFTTVDVLKILYFMCVKILVLKEDLKILCLICL